jgi:hypothetical protein
VHDSEDDFVLPGMLAQRLHPRRGGAVGEPFAADPGARAATDRIAVDWWGGVFGVLHDAATDAVVREAAGRWLAGEPDAPPAGAAAVASIKLADGRSGPAAAAGFADMWISERGLRFAVLAAAELASLVVADDAHPDESFFTAHPCVRYLRPGERRESRAPALPILLRVRAALAAAPQDQFEDAVVALEPYRSAHAHARAACSVLVPRPDWLAADVTDTVAEADDCRASYLLHAAGTAEQAAALASIADRWYLQDAEGLVSTLVDGAGPAVAPVLFRWLDGGYAIPAGVSVRRSLLTALAALPGDEVLRGLLSRSGDRDTRAALVEAAGRFPRRALRILAEEAPADLMSTHVLRCLDIVEQVLPQLSSEAAARVRAVVGYASGAAAAPLAVVPPVLTDPPWRRRRQAPKPPAVVGLTCSDDATASWLPGERAEWAETPFRRGRSVPDWDELAGYVAAGICDLRDTELLFTRGPVEIAGPAFARWRPETTWQTPIWLRIVAARLGTDALPILIGLARRAPATYGSLLLPFASPDVASLMADWLVRLKSVRSLAGRWLMRHPSEAARAMVPAALSSAGAARRQAERTLLMLHANGCTDVVRSAAASYGPEAAAGVEALLTADPLTVLPARMPTVPAWVVPVLLPRVRLRGDLGPLPAEAVLNLVTMLIISRAEDPYAGLEAVRAAVEPADLAEFAWGLFEQWQATGAGAKGSWVLEALALLGDGDTVRRLSALILSSPGHTRTAGAAPGLSVLVGIGSDEALLQLYRISRRATSARLRAAAAVRVTEVADGLGLSADQLADRLVPRFGLDDAGSLLLDYGWRQFVVGFDEQLRPFVTGHDGRRLKTLPKPGARDDAEMAGTAYKRFTVLKKDVRIVTTEQAYRLERAMVDGRRWTGSEFRRLFVGHPLMWHLARRLVWTRFSSDGAPDGALRIAEDRSLATVGDETAGLADDDVVGVAHPLHLGADLPRWVEVFTDYELLQPFPQLGRSTFVLADDEMQASHLKRFEGLTVPTTGGLLLDCRGWRRDQPGDGGVHALFERPVGRGQVVTVRLDPRTVGFHGEQTLVSVHLHDSTASQWDEEFRKELPLGDLDPIAASEILRDLTDVVG